jgi:hypothetical protein
MAKESSSPKRKIVANKTSGNPSQRRAGARKEESFPLLFNKQTFLYMGIGCGLIALGLILMLGGGMDDPAVWDESVIYSPIRITLAPIVILAGLGMQIYAIFKK